MKFIQYISDLQDNTWFRTLNIDKDEPFIFHRLSDWKRQIAALDGKQHFCGKYVALGGEFSNMG